MQGVHILYMRLHFSSLLSCIHVRSIGSTIEVINIDLNRVINFLNNKHVFKYKQKVAQNFQKNQKKLEWSKLFSNYTEIGVISSNIQQKQINTIYDRENPNINRTLV